MHRNFVYNMLFGSLIKLEKLKAQRKICYFSGTEVQISENVTAEGYYLRGNSRK